MEYEDHLVEIKEALAGIQADLKYHIRRTDILEAEFKPVKRQSEFITSLFKITLALIGAAAAIAATIKTFKGM